VHVASTCSCACATNRAAWPLRRYLTGKTQYFYVVALEHTARFAAVAGDAAGQARYTALADAARALYMQRLYINGTSCFSNCTYVNQIFGLSLQALPSGRPGSPGVEEAAAWGHVLAAIGPNATDPQKAGRFGGGIVTLKLVYPLFEKFGEAALALRTLLHTDRSPSLGFMTTEGPSNTTLHEAWSMRNAYQGSWVGSFNHIMLGSPGRWFYTLFAGIRRAPAPAHNAASRARAGTSTGGVGGRDLPAPTPSSWSRLVLAPPRAPALWADLAWCSGSVRTPLGEVSVRWALGNATAAAPPAAGGPSSGAVLYSMQAAVPVGARAVVVVPTVSAASGVTMHEGASVIWADGAYHPGTPGIDAATLGVDGVSVELRVGSGNFSLVVSAGALLPP